MGGQAPPTSSTAREDERTDRALLLTAPNTTSLLGNLQTPLGLEMATLEEEDDEETNTALAESTTENDDDDEADEDTLSSPFPSSDHSRPPVKEQQPETDGDGLGGDGERSRKT